MTSPISPDWTKISSGISNFDRKKALEVLRKVVPPNEAYYLNNKSDIELILLLNTVKSHLTKEKNNIVTEQTSKLEGKLKSLRQLRDTARKIKEEIGSEIPDWILTEQLEDNINFTKQEITPRLISLQDWESKVDGFTQKIELELGSSIVASIVKPIKNGRFSLDLTPLESLKTQTQLELGKKEKEFTEKYGNIDFVSTKRDAEDIIQKIDTVIQDLSILKKKLFLNGFLGKLFGMIQKVSKIKEDTLKVVEETSNVFYKYGVTYRKACQYDKAIGKYTRAIELNPNYASAYNERGICYDALKQHHQAIVDYTEAIGLNPKEAVYYYYNRGDSYQNLELYDKSITDSTEAIKLNPNYKAAYNLRGVSYYRSNQYNKALPDFEKAIELNPRESVYYKNRGSTYRKLGQDAEAEKDFNKAKELEK